MTVRGLDASSVQGLLPIKDLDARGLKFLIAKCQEGNKGKDPYFERNTAAAKDLGWFTGAYHFLYPLPHLDPKAQAELFFKASDMGTTAGDLPPALDIEWPAVGAEWTKWKCNASQISDWSQACTARVEELFGRPPILYTYPHFLSSMAAGSDVSWVTKYPLWIAADGSQGKWPAEGQGPNPKLYKPWDNWTFWQCDWVATPARPIGIYADSDVFNGSWEDLQVLAGVKPHPDLDHLQR